MTVTDRFAGRRWRARLGRLRPYLLVAAALAVIGAGAWVTLETSVLGAHSVQVRGATTVSPSVVRARADVVEGRPLARLDVEAVRERVEQIPQVATVDVSRRWPRSVVVEVTERTPVARLSGDDVRLLDRDGVVYPPAGKTPRRLPRVVLASGSGPRAEALKEAADAVRAMDRDLARRVREVRVSSRDGITLELRDGAEVAWGSADHAGLKAQVLSALLPQKASAYDVRAPERPTIRP
ncbi:FtsQ-type POTRA domain-containing protein [Mumia sp. zg.B53]|uniref:cell division protein FtsQ/DivIB n=1 Tax=unclassified Mumia TaxID=2621872 RepID=UPI001C6E3E4B|nr:MULTISPECIES: FtsQ-type POTRA domain-containing protein [unclassified Mumia]MBW9206231.1 FtsQ-type POTRA domain-containing protein [Mumia sp. zg.B17]MBW9211475.1 FtsQ-type POTRA domain-containing protein [Mumia sp. zg.B21]MBW9216648.1 FtsQ-type POTRA domain-containing protein [Mumia sp. zg.B53]MDD9349760.1 FtsQ-type POTRA domain-containing protein [Mumia sp.]